MLKKRPSRVKPKEVRVYEDEENPEFIELIDSELQYIVNQLLKKGVKPNVIRKMIIERLSVTI